MDLSACLPTIKKKKKNSWKLHAYIVLAFLFEEENHC
jgi:hypothetical protein